MTEIFTNILLDSMVSQIIDVICENNLRIYIAVHLVL